MFDINVNHTWCINISYVISIYISSCINLSFTDIVCFKSICFIHSSEEFYFQYCNTGINLQTTKKSIDFKRGGEPECVAVSRDWLCK